MAIPLLLCACEDIADGQNLNFEKNVYVDPDIISAIENGTFNARYRHKRDVRYSKNESEKYEKSIEEVMIIGASVYGDKCFYKGKSLSTLTFLPFTGKHNNADAMYSACNKVYEKVVGNNSFTIPILL